MSAPVYYAEARDSGTGTLRERGEERDNRDVAEDDAEELRAKWVLATTVRVREVAS